MIVNGKIAATALAGNGGVIAVVTKIDGNKAEAQIPVKLEDIGKVLAIAEVSLWENLVGASIRINYVQNENGDYAITNILNYLEDNASIEIDNSESEPEAVEAEPVESAE